MFKIMSVIDCDIQPEYDAQKNINKTIVIINSNDKLIIVLI